MTYAELDQQHTDLLTAHKRDPAATDTLSKGTGLALRIAFIGGVSAEDAQELYALRLNSFTSPAHKELFREAFSLSASIVGAAIREALDVKEVVNAVA